MLVKFGADYQLFVERLCSLIALNSALFFFNLLDSHFSFSNPLYFLFYSRSDLFGITEFLRTEEEKQKKRETHCADAAEHGQYFAQLFDRMINLPESRKKEKWEDGGIKKMEQKGTLRQNLCTAKV